MPLASGAGGDVALPPPPPPPPPPSPPASTASSMLSRRVGGDTVREPEDSAAVAAAASRPGLRRGRLLSVSETEDWRRFCAVAGGGDGRREGEAGARASGTTTAEARMLCGFVLVVSVAT